MIVRRILALAALLVSGSALSLSQDELRDLGSRRHSNTHERERDWSEEQASPPAFPNDGDLVEFQVSVHTQNRYFIDASTLAVGGDGVVRYVLVVRASGGASNVTFEGIRCATGEYKLYASGRADATWARAHSDQWRPIENKTVNRHHTVLNRELFCHMAMPVASPDEGRQALRLGKHPRAP